MTRWAGKILVGCYGPHEEDWAICVLNVSCTTVYD